MTMSDTSCLTAQQTVALLRALRQARYERLRRENEFQRVLRNTARKNRLRNLFSSD